MSAHVGMHRLHAGGGGSHLCAGAPVRVAGGRRQISWYVWMEKPVGTEERVPAVTGLTYSALTPQSKPSRARSRPGQVYINRAGEPRRLDTGTTHLPARPSGYERYDKGRYAGQMSPAAQCPPMFFPDTVPCAGGTCASATSCACPAGLSSRGDFVFAGGFHCGLNLQVIAALWILCAVVQFVGMCAAALLLINTHTVLNRIAGRSARTRPRSVFGALLLVSAAFELAMSVRRAIDVESTAIGVDVTTSVLFFFGGVSGYLALFALTYNLLLLVLGQTKFSDVTQRREANFLNATFVAASPISIVLLLVTYSVVLGMLGAPNRQTMFALGAVHLVGASLLTAWIGLFVFRRVTTHVIADVSQSIQISPGSREKEAMVQILHKLEAARTNGIYGALANAVPLAVIGLWPWLQGFAAYYLPLAVISLSAVLTHGAYLLFPVSSMSTAPSDEREGETAMSSPQSAESSSNLR